MFINVVELLNQTSITMGSSLLFTIYRSTSLIFLQFIEELRAVDAPSNCNCTFLEFQVRERIEDSSQRFGLSVLQTIWCRSKSILKTHRSGLDLTFFRPFSRSS
ncbi:uncharacterized protein LOC114075167 [Solanum pennellii]|uniref:Uncharacterized protein LOC114075167 n=1 Tax=Solanum pennellii TaxID=28526 RepID=A0ABM1V0J7_SOLPN|nr:uncharacterized protein LOC114075167 [Solanum pennellii]